MPPLRICAGGVEDLAALVGLSSCLPGDSEGSSDVGPAGSLGAGRVDHQTRGDVEGFSGVSQPLEVVHRPLSAAADGAQGVDRASDPPAGVCAGLGAHNRSVNRNCHRSNSIGGRRPEMSVHNARNSVSGDSNIGSPATGRRRAWGARALISSYISRRGRPKLAQPETTENAKDPREAATSGGQITTTGQALWRRSNRT